MAEKNPNLLERGDSIGATPKEAAGGRKGAVAIVIAAAAVAFLASCYVIERAGLANLPGEITDYLAALVLTALIIGLVRAVRGEANHG